MNELLGKDIFDEDNDLSVDTVNELRTLQIEESAKAEPLKAICYRARREFNLKQVAEKVDYWFSRTQFVMAHECEKNWSVITNLVEIEDICVSTVIEIEAALASADADVCRAHFEGLKVRAERWRELARDLHEMQPIYIRFRSIFTSSRLSRHFTQYTRDFSVVDDLWKPLMRMGQDGARRLVADYFDDTGPATDGGEGSRVSEDMPISGASPTVFSIGSLIAPAKEAISVILKALDVFVDELRLKWAKLYLLDRETIVKVVATANLWVVFDKVGTVLLPALTSVSFDQIDKSTTIAVESDGEVIHFDTAISSSRVGFVEWMRSIESACDFQLKTDVELFSSRKRNVIEDAVNPKCSDQSRVLALQVELWQSFEQVAEGEPKKRDERLETLSDMLHKCSSILSGLKSGSVHMKGMINLVLVLSHCRPLGPQLFYAVQTKPRPQELLVP